MRYLWTKPITDNSMPCVISPCDWTGVRALSSAWQVNHSPFVISNRFLADWEMYWLTAGQMSFRSCGKKWNAKPGECWIWPPHSLLSISSSGRFSAFHAHFILERQSLTLPLAPVKHFFGQPANRKLFALLTQELQTSLKSVSLHSSAKANTSLILMLQLLSPNRANRSSLAASYLNRQEGTFRKIIQAVQCSLFTSKTLKELALEVHLHPDHMNRIFRLYTSRSIQSYRNEMRLAKAKDLLKKAFSVKKTAQACGFNDALYFSRMFKRAAGISPSAFATGSSA